LRTAILKKLNQLVSFAQREKKHTIALSGLSFTVLRKLFKGGRPVILA
jgi:hypothetical protein